MKSISLGLSGSVGIQGHAVAEAPTGVAGASCMYILWGLDFGVGVLSDFVGATFRISLRLITE